MAKDTIKQLNEQLTEIEKKITKLYGSTYAYAAQLAQVRAALAKGEEFEWKKNPEAAKQIEQRITSMAEKLDTLLANSTEKSYGLGQASTENSLVSIFGKSKSSKEEVESTMAEATAAMRKRGADAHAFYTQPQGGVTISKRVWNMNESTKLELEIAIQNAALEGKSADELAREIQQYLKYPDRLYRHVRVKDPETGEWTGEYRMSKAAQNASPVGRGVYRSSYANAMRLARTELTQAYRRAEWETYQDNPLITGYRIELSNNHTTKTYTKTGVKLLPLHDICDEMAGTEYPKTFLWTGWHPQCRCRMVPITITSDDFKERVKARHNGTLDSWKPEHTTTEMPESYTKWVEENKEKWEKKGGATPFFIRDNYKDGKVSNGLNLKSSGFLGSTASNAEAAATNATTARATSGKSTNNANTESNTSGISQQNLKNLEYLREIADKYDEKLNLDLCELYYQSGENEKLEKQLKYAIQTILNKKKELTDLENGIKAYRDEVQKLLDNHTGDGLDSIKKEAEEYIKTIDNTITEFGLNGNASYKMSKRRMKAILKTAGNDIKHFTDEFTRMVKGEKQSRPDIGNKKFENKELDANAKIDLTKQIANRAGCTQQDAKEYREAVFNFTYKWDYDIRYYQSHGKTCKSQNSNPKDAVKRKAEQIEQFIHKSPKYNGTTYRGISVTKKTWEAIMKQLKRGEAIDMLGTSSWSTERSTAEKFSRNGNNEVRIIFICRGKTYGTSIAPYSRFKKEHEILCSKDARWVLDKSLTQNIEEAMRGEEYYVNLVCDSI